MTRERELKTESSEQLLRLAMKSKADAQKLAQNVRGKRRYERSSNVSCECPEPAVMTVRIESSSPETANAGYPFTLIIGCRIPKRKLH